MKKMKNEHTTKRRRTLVEEEAEGFSVFVVLLLGSLRVRPWSVHTHNARKQSGCF
jgi:hypothetical protein